MSDSLVDVGNSASTISNTNTACDINTSGGSGGAFSDAANRPHLEGREIKNSTFKLIGRCFAAGSFGEIHLTQSSESGEIFATKLAHKENPNAKLRHEYELYRKLGPAPGLPKVLFFGDCHPYDALVMELLGPSLERVFNSCSRRFSLRTTTQIAVQILELMRYIHSQKIIFCNCKPENFCLGRPDSPKANQVHLIGFTHARTFLTEQHEHIPKTSTSHRTTVNADNFGHSPNQQKEDGEDSCSSLPPSSSSSSRGAVSGTPRYMSLNAHKGKVLSRRDDLESIGYMLLYFLKSKLPWQGLQLVGCNDLEKYERIYSMKKTIRLEELCAGLPAEYYHYMLYVRTLKFAEEPNYRYLLKMFNKLLHRIGDLEQITSQFAVYDWDEQQQQLQRQPLQVTRQSINQRGHASELLLSAPVSPVPPNSPTITELQVPRSPSGGPFRKQVSFKEEHESVSITADDYFPFVRNAAYAEDYLRQTYGNHHYYYQAASGPNFDAVATLAWENNNLAPRLSTNSTAETSFEVTATAMGATSSSANGQRTSSAN